MKRWLSSLAILIGGFSLNGVALTLADRHATHFPSVPDIIVDNLPFANLFDYGELYLGLYTLAFLVVYLRHPSRNAPYLLALIGIAYMVRAVFLLTLPIGAPEGAIHADHRTSFYLFGDHAYFPSGHCGLMFLLALNVQNRIPRRLFFVAATLFAIGTLFTKAHYSADILGGFLVAYATYAWGERELKHRWVDSGVATVPDTQLASESVDDRLGKRNA